MNEVYVKYARKLKILGDWIISISERFDRIKPDKTMDVEDLKLVYEIYKNGVDEYKQCRLNLVDIVPPDIVRKEHQKMINGVQLFIDGSEILYKSLDIVENTFDTDMSKKGLLLQKQGKDLVVKTAQEMALKLSK